MIVQDLSSLPQQTAPPPAIQADRGGPSTGKILLSLLMSLPRLVIAIPVMIFRILQAILLFWRNAESRDNAMETQETNLGASYENALVRLAGCDEATGYVHFQMNRDALVLFADNLGSSLHIDSNPQTKFQRTRSEEHTSELQSQ